MTAADPPPTSRPGRFTTWAVLLAWPPALAAGLVYWFARYGFSPTDQGFVLGLSWRILQGQIPHTDIVSARPLGSALVHTVDFAIPGPLYIDSMTLAVVEIIVATIALIAFVSRVRYGDWLRSWRTALLLPLAAFAAVTDLGSFVAMAWHTVDGFFFTALGWYLLDAGLRDGRAGQRRIGLFLAGFAPLCKQSFALAPVVAVVMLVVRARRDAADPSPAARWTRRRWAGDLAALLAAPVVYAAAVTGTGGLGAAVDQLTTAQRVWGRDLLVGFWTKPGGADIVWIAVVAALLTVRIAVRGTGATARDLRFAAGLVVSAIAVASVFAGHFAFGSGALSFWILATVLAAEALRRHFAVRAALVLSLGWMASLSWGWAVPDLLAGAMAASCVLVLLTDVPRRLAAWTAPALPVRGTMRAVAVGAVLLATVAVSEVVGGDVRQARADYIYRDQTMNRLAFNAGSVIPALAGIRTSAPGISYLRQIRDCVAAHPARWQAVLPETPGIYAALKLHSPFPLDYWSSQELVGDARQRILDTATRMHREGGYLVLFQTFTAEDVKLGVPGAVAPSAQLYDLDPPLVRDVEARLDGQVFACGSFIGVYQAGAAR